MAISRLEHWTGNGISVVIICTLILSARSDIIAEQRAARRDKAIEKLGDVSAAVGGLSSQLDSHALMFVEAEGCLKRHRENPKICWQRIYRFDPQAAAESWIALEAKTVMLRPYLDQGESALLDSLSEIMRAHAADLKPMLPPTTPEESQRVSNRILKTRQQLTTQYSKLEKELYPPPS